nr:putative reverse transcriptase domain-containing protein [Tanacetum cinerariifolium]
MQGVSLALNVEFKDTTRKCLSDEPLVISLDEVHIDDKLRFVEEPVEVMDREKKPDKMENGQEEGTKNYDQKVETASGKYVTSSGAHSGNVWNLATASGSAVDNEALKTLTRQRLLD